VRYLGQVVVVMKTQLMDEDGEFGREVRMLEQLSLHPNIVIMLGACIEPCCIAMEYCARGFLYDNIRKHPEGS
jgi:serine/threonine protein kinase